MIATLKPSKIRTKRITEFERAFPVLIENAQATIYKKLGMLPPPVAVSFELVDIPGVPMVEVTGYTSDPSHIKMSLHAVDSDFHGYTSTQKVIIHELVHSYFMHYGGVRYPSKPLWLKEGIALWTAGQTYEADFQKVPPDIRNGRWAEYLGYIQRFEEALRQGYSPEMLRDALLG